MRFAASAVDGIQPFRGWTLCAMPEEDDEGFVTTGYIAHSDDEDRLLHVSRFHFTPTQRRFEQLILSDFAPGPSGSWTDAALDAEWARSPRLAA